MVWIPGSNNGTIGFGLSRGAVFPAGMNGPFGKRGYPLPINLQFPTGVTDKKFKNRAFGTTVYQLTPGGITTEAGWGFKNNAFGKRSKRRSRFSKKRNRNKRNNKYSNKCSNNFSKKRRCKGIKKNGKRCKHMTTCTFCGHH